MVQRFATLRANASLATITIRAIERAEGLWQVLQAIEREDWSTDRGNRERAALSAWSDSDSLAKHLCRVAKVDYDKARNRS